MAAQGSFLDRVMSLPKWVLAAIAVTFVSLVGFGIYASVFGLKKPEPEDPGTVLLDMPDAAEGRVEQSRAEAYRMGEFAEDRGSGLVDDYWNSLGGELVSSGNRDENDLSFLENGEYSERDKYFIRQGLKTREEVDREHEQSRMMAELYGLDKGSPSQTASAPRELTAEQKDSAYFARLERSYEIAMRYAQPYASGGQTEDAGSVSSPAAEPQKEEQQGSEPQARKLDLDSAPAVLPTDSFSDGIISSLDAPEDGGVVHYAGGVARKPVKATFLKSEKLADGQRVIIRLMQDLHLADGTLVPANTHITGICSFGSRLRIDVNMLHYGGRMFPVNISVYDNDGTEGIYCPVVESRQKRNRVAKDVASGAMGAVGTAASGLLRSNPFVGQIASRAIGSLTAATSQINADGSVSVNVVSGYEFYVFENVDERKK